MKQNEILPDLKLTDYKKLIRNKLHNKKSASGVIYKHDSGCPCTWCKKAEPKPKDDSEEQKTLTNN